MSLILLNSMPSLQSRHSHNNFSILIKCILTCENSQMVHLISYTVSLNTLVSLQLLLLLFLCMEGLHALQSARPLFNACSWHWWQWFRSLSLSFLFYNLVFILYENTHYLNDGLTHNIKMKTFVSLFYQWHPVLNCLVCEVKGTVPWMMGLDGDLF